MLLPLHLNLWEVLRPTKELPKKKRKKKNDELLRIRQANEFNVVPQYALPEPIPMSRVSNQISIPISNTLPVKEYLDDDIMLVMAYVMAE